MLTLESQPLMVESEHTIVAQLMVPSEAFMLTFEAEPPLIATDAQLHVPLVEVILNNEKDAAEGGLHCELNSLDGFITVTMGRPRLVPARIANFRAAKPETITSNVAEPTDAAFSTNNFANARLLYRIQKLSWRRAIKSSTSQALSH